MFDRAFASQQQPPSPQEWAAVLTRLSEEHQRCTVNADHWKLGDVCGACAREDRRRAAALAQVAVPPARPRPRPQPVKRPVPLVAGSRALPLPKRRRHAKALAILGLGTVAGLAAFFLVPTLSGKLAQSQERVGPSFECGRVHVALGQVICSDQTLSRQELQFVQAYQALRQQTGVGGQTALRKQAIDFQAQVISACGLPAAQAASADLIRTAKRCVSDQYNGQRNLWLASLSGEAREEATRSPERHIALQRRLQALSYLPSNATIDGVYGTGTRVAISAWQRAQNLPVTGLLGDAAADRLEPVPTRASTDPSVVTEPASSKVLSYFQDFLNGLLLDGTAPHTSGVASSEANRPYDGLTDQQRREQQRRDTPPGEDDSQPDPPAEQDDFDKALAALARGAANATPDQPLTCYDFLRGLQFQDPDVIRRATALIKPLIDAHWVPIMSVGEAYTNLALNRSPVLSHLVDDCKTFRTTLWTT